MDNKDKREITHMYSKQQRKMIVLPADSRPTVGAYKRFKTPAFSVPTKRRRSDTQ